MAAYDFPSGPSEDQEYTPPVGGQTYIYKAPRWLVKGIPPAGGGGGINEAPTDGQQYGRQSTAWSVVTPNPTWSTLTGKPATFPPTVPIAWTDVSGKPSTFPPTLPIAESDVTNLVTDLAAKAPLASPVFTGDPQAPTPAAADNDTSVATTAFVKTAVAALPVATAQTRSRIVNGAMQISQENGNTALTAVNTYPADQWAHNYATTGTMTAQRVQSVTPNGSQNRYRVTITVADAALAAGDVLRIIQAVEGTRIADFRWGSASTKQVILRFGFKGPAGTYSAAINNAAANRSYVASFTISAGQANTDTEQVLVIPGDTTGTWPVDTALGLSLIIALAVGSTYQGAIGWQAGSFAGTAANSNGMATAGNVFELFDVGLYLDPNNTGLPPPWQMPDEAQELAACMRYWQKFGVYFTGNTTTAIGYHGIGNLLGTTRGGAVSGVNVQNSGFAATVGSFDFPTGAVNMIREIRAANATANGSFFSTTAIVNARM